jgi:O-antigen ligase
MDVASEKPLVWAFGVGPAGIPELYDNTLLNALDIEVADGTYYPLHSDVVLTFLETGFLGLLMWGGAVIAMFLQTRRSGLNFCSASAITIFVLYSFFDMLIYSPFAVWLLTQAMVTPLDAPAVLPGKPAPEAIPSNS